MVLNLQKWDNFNRHFAIKAIEITHRKYHLATFLISQTFHHRNPKWGLCMVSRHHRNCVKKATNGEPSRDGDFNLGVIQVWCSYHLVMTNRLPWKDPPFLIGKPSISIRAIYTMAMLNNQRVYDMAPQNWPN